MKKKVLIVVANYYKKISKSLLSSAVSEIKNFAPPPKESKSTTKILSFEKKS